MVKIEMPHPEHDKHLCYLRNLGFQTTNPEDYKALIRDGKFYCESCGRVAVNSKSLCQPKNL